jgi:hypothetical protein
MISRSLGLSTVMAMALGTAAPAQGALLVYEGYNGYSDIDDTTLPNSNTTGLNTTIPYAGNLTGNPGIGTGLTLSNLQVSGGALTFSGGTVVAGAQLSLASPYTGTLYGSYLVNLATRGTSSGNGMEFRLANDDSTGGIRFRSNPDSRNGTDTTTALTYGGALASGSQSLLLNTTYLFINRFTNVGSALNATTTGTATSWALTAAQFDLLMAAPDREAYLDAATAGVQVTAKQTVTDVTGGPFVFQSGNRVQFVEVGDAGAFDEFRFAPTLTEVVPVPEPASLGIAAIAGALLLRRQSRRRA